MLRLAAVVLVLGRHIDLCPPETNRIIHAVTLVWERGGWCGVDLFFVLSGYLVSALLFKEHLRYGKISVQNFLIRRGLKIYPAFYFLIFITAIDFAHSHSLSRWALFRELVFIQNYAPGLWNHTWSLAVEEHFYLALCIGCFLAVRLSGQGKSPFINLPYVFAFVAIACLAYRIFWPVAPENMYYEILFPTHSRIDSLLFGVLLSYFAHYKQVSISKPLRLIFAFTALMAFAIPFVFVLEKTPFVYSAGLSFLYLGGGLLILSLRDWEPKSTPLVRALAFTGSRSYSIYLWHMPVAIWGTALAHRFLPFGWNWYWYAAIYFSGSIAVGIIMAEIIEMPVIKFRDRFFPSRNQAAHETAVAVSI